MISVTPPRKAGCSTSFVFSIKVKLQRGGARVAFLSAGNVPIDWWAQQG